MSKWKKVSTKVVFQNQWVSLDLDQVVGPNGQSGEYSVINSSDVVAIVALSEKNEVYLVRLHRYPFLAYSWEIIKGRTDGEAPLAAATRELQEETGLIAKEMIEVGYFQPLNGLARETTYTYLAKGLTQTNQNEQAEEGITAVKPFPLDQVEQMIKDNEILDGQTISALYKVKLYMENNHG